MDTKRVLVRLGISALVLALFLLHVSGVSPVPLLERLEALSHDARVRISAPHEIDPRVVIVDIDDRSLSELGQWPWPRDVLARLVTALFDDYGIDVLGIDIVFAEADGKSPAALLARQDLPADAAGPLRAAIEQYPERWDTDLALAAAMRGRRVVMGTVFKQGLRDGEAASVGALGPPLSGGGASLPLDFVAPRGFVGNVDVLQAAAADAGFFDNPLTDADGVYRRVPVVQRYEGELYPSLALAVTRLAMNAEAVAFEFDPPEPPTALSLERMHIGPLSARLDRNVAVYVPYRGYQGSFPYVSAADVIEGRADHSLLRGRIVLIGTTAPGLLDFRVTPIENPFAGVEIHANIVSALLDNRTLQKAPYYLGIEVAWLLLLALIVALVVPRLSPVAGAGLFALLAAAVIATAVLLWQQAHFIMPLGLPLVFLLALFVAHMVYGLLIETRAKRRVSRVFGQYVPPELVAELAERDEQVTLDGEAREMTVLFSDVRDFTAISEQMEPRALTEMMNAFLSAETRLIQEQRGTIDKYMGDALMAFWGAPLPETAHATLALRAALGMRAAVEALNPEFRARGWPEIRVGVGLATGVMRVGNMGSAFRMAYTVMGDPVNLGSRLEGLTKTYGVGVICSEATRLAAPADWAFRELDCVRVKGRSTSEAIFEPLGPKDALAPEQRDALARHRGALRHYRAQQWDEAELAFARLATEDPAQRVYPLFLQRIAQLRQHPPGADWDGAYTHTEK
jgi:adenylate cyclase